MNIRYGMVSHQITDLLDRNYFYRRRGSSKYSRCDGMLWLGYYHACKWPDNVNNLMQLGTICPCPYLLKLWKYVNFIAVTNGLWNIFPNVYGQSLTLTTSTTDIYNNMPIASSLKSTIELNHTTLLGCLTGAFKKEWYSLHRKHNLIEIHTIDHMRCYLNKCFNNINGMKSILVDFKNKITVFNQMGHSW